MLPFEGRVTEDWIQSGIEDHIYVTTNVRKHFPREEWSTAKNRRLEVDSLME